jgi:CO/xanthine dehydrogenase FAD-binding subunit
MPHVGHGATRARGTIGGSLANADHAAEIVLVAATLDATLVWREGGADRECAAADFFLGPMVTALPQAACLIEARFPVWPETRLGVGFHEVNARRSDFAFVSAAAQVALDPDGRFLRAAIGIGGATPVPLRLHAVEAALAGQPFDQQQIGDLIRTVLADIEPLADLHASAEYRRRVAGTLAMRALNDAIDSAKRRI